MSPGRSLSSGFLQHAKDRPASVALTAGGHDYSYEEMALLARRLARAILGAAGRPVERVGVLAARSETTYSGVLGALLSGAAFVPLNPSFPPARTHTMIRRSRLDAIVADAAAIGVLHDLNPLPPVVVPTELQELAPLDPLPAVPQDRIAYLLFTSGSTGEPKGVPITHANVLHFLDRVQERYRFTPEDRFSQTFDHTFDLSIFDMFAAWGSGARVCAMRPIDLLAPTRYVNENAITVWFSVPSIPALMMKKRLLAPGTMPSLRFSLFCGEPLPMAAARAWQAAAPGSIVENLYGPTELTIACFAHRWDPASSPSRCVHGVVPIGSPFPGLHALIVDAGEGRDGRAEGELLVGGPQTAPGYWEDAAKTAERFVVPRGERTRFYRTGDRVARIDGEYVFLGRTDQQIKVLGHRVELGEVEGALRAAAGVTEAAALGWPVADGVAESIAAFVCGAGVDPDSVRQAARDRLPDYMVPRAVHVVERMPRNPNGKVDREALRATLLLAGRSDQMR